MKILVLGGDGYLGWPTSMYFAARGHDVLSVDNYLRRTMAIETNSEALIPTLVLTERARIFKERTGKHIQVSVRDLAHPDAMHDIMRDFKPDAVIHYAEQPSAPYSMASEHQARLTLQNNLNVTFNLICAVMKYAPDCHIIKLGTMGEYGTPNIDIEEGWIDIEHKGRKDKFLFPRAAGSLYHTTKVLDTDLLWFYVRIYGLRVTDLMQGPVYGLETEETGEGSDLLPNFHYDDIFGTAVNRFLIQAIAGVPLTVYGKGGQTRGYLNIRDTLQCVDLAVRSPVAKGQLRIMNQFTELFAVNELANRVRDAGAELGIDVKVQNLENPRKEREEHYYNAQSTALLDLGLKPHLMTQEVLVGMMQRILGHRDRIDKGKILPRVRWS
jgi:UDP-sulfoquinovose synthase